MLGRSNSEINRWAVARSSRWTISSRVRASAVAVRQEVNENNISESKDEKLIELSGILEIYRDKLLKEGVVRDVEFTGIDLSGREFPVRISTGIVKNNKIKPEYFVTIFRDISSEIAAEKKLQYSLKEKDILIEEINSRVKNNLTLISSLLGLQLIDNENIEIEELVKKSQHRINSMALIHEKLYE